MNNFNAIIRNIGIELGIKVKVFSDGWLKILEKNNEIHYITGYQFDLNNHGIGNIMDDKGLFWNALKYKNIPIIDQYIIFKNYDKDDILNYFMAHNKEIIVKGNIGNAGNEVFKVNSKKELFKTIDKLFLKEFSISLCPYYSIKNEYRVVVLDNEIKLVFGKIKPYIVGDGKSTVLELAKEYSDYYISHFDIIENKDYIPKLNEKIELSFKFNLSSGGKTFLDIPTNLKKQITDLALEVTNELNITFASIDIIHTNDDQLLVMEANSGVTLNKFMQENGCEKIAYNIYRDAIKLMFKE